MIVIFQTEGVGNVTSDRGDDLIQEFHAGPFPDLLYDGPQFLIGLLKVTCSERSSESVNEP